LRFQVRLQSRVGLQRAQRQANEGKMLCLVQVSPIARIVQFVLDFVQRPRRICEEAFEFGRLEPAEPFGGVSRDRRGGISNLIAIFEIA
jgi:hypothetical protein